MSRVNRNSIGETSQCGNLSHSPPTSCYFVGTSNSNPTSPGSSNNNSPASTGVGSGVNGSSSVVGSSGSLNVVSSTRRTLPNVYNAIEYLDAMDREADNNFDMLKPLLMLNIESIQTLRADCKYRKARR